MVLHVGVRRWAAPVLGAAFAVLLLPALVAAHSELVSSDPAQGAIVPSRFSSPIVLTFSEALSNGSKAEMYGPGEARYANDAIDPAKPAQMTISFEGALELGLYRVEWVSIANDGDLLRGTATFTVTSAPSPTPEPSSAATTVPSSARAAMQAPVTPAGSVRPTATPSGSSDTSGSSDLVVPIVVALIVLGAGAAYLLSRRNRPPDLT